MTNRARKSPEQTGQDERFEAQLAAGIEALAGTGQWQAFLEVQAKFRAYSFQNTLLIMLQRPDATQVMKRGDKNGGWISIGRDVIDGEQPLYIRHPNIRTVKADKSDDGRDHSYLAGFFWVPVYDIEQTEGDPVPQPVRLLEGDDPEDILGRVVAFIESRGYAVEFLPVIPGGANGDCDLKGRVRIATQGRSKSQQAKTAIHEAAHMLLHPRVLISREQQELEAESVAYIVGQHLGFATDDYSFGYVLTWMGGNPERARKVINKCGSRIQKGARQILDYLDGAAAQAGDQESAGGAGVLQDVA